MTRHGTPVDFTLVLPVHKALPATREFLNDLHQMWPTDWPMVIVDNEAEGDVRAGLSTRFRVLRLDKNVGYGGAVRKALSFIDTERLLWAPTNGKITGADLLAFAKEASTLSADVVKARRISRPLKFELKSIAAGVFHTFVLGANMFDSGGTPTLANAAFLREVALEDMGPDFDAWTWFIAKDQNMRVRRIPCVYVDSRAPKSSWRRGLSSELQLLAKISGFRQKAQRLFES